VIIGKLSSCLTLPCYSGCVTSTESMLITLQSHLEVQAYIQAHQPSQPDERRDSRKAVLSISPQTLASLVTSYSESPSSSYAVPLTPSRLLRRIRNFLTQPEHGGWSGVWDTNFARQLSLREHVKEFKERSRVGKGKDAMVTENGSSSQEGKITPFTGGGLPMLASACPGWVCYAEKAHGDLLGFVSHTRSPQAVMGSLVKKWWATEAGCRYIFPCTHRFLDVLTRRSFLDLMTSTMCL
jgi:iron only hydrogenase large subunit-like protein